MVRDDWVKRFLIHRAGASATPRGQIYGGVLALLMLVISACLPGADTVVDEKSERAVQDVALHFEQRVILPTSTLIFRVRNSDRMVAEGASVTLRGRHSVQGPFEQTYPARLTRDGDVGDLLVELPVASKLWDDTMQGRVAASDKTQFSGAIDVELSDALGVLAGASLAGIELEFVPYLEPSARAIEVGDVFPGERIAVEGSGFLRPSEGRSVAFINLGQVEYADGTQRDISGESVALDWAGSRERAYFRVDPGVFGVQVASFTATVHLVNQLEGAGEWPGTQVFDIQGHIQQPYVATLSPQAGSRGQKIRITGRGLVPNQAESGYGMLLRYVGTLTPDDPTLSSVEIGQSTPVLRAPDHVLDEQNAEQNIWYTIEEGRTLSGLGAVPGVFSGTITPELFDRWGSQEGIGWQGDFRVLPTRQVVYLKYLPSFSSGLEKYGLRNVELEIRRRILEVARRDYNGINIEFRDEKPDDFMDYATLELGGPDPSGHNAFGYDNTYNGVAKDTGNLYLNDYLGGLNAQSGQQFNNPYGGIFLESFAFFSLELNPESSHASAEFDRIMRPFMPALGGQAVRGTEWPDGPRGDAIAAAILMVGNVLGNTVSHEIGHSLGMTFVPEDEVAPTNFFHNIEYGPYIMDPGEQRPFEERAELNGQGPAVFSEQNYGYLRKYLPAD